MIPSRSLRELTAVFSDDIEQVEVFFANNQILFRSEHISFYTRLLEGNYPDTDRLIPTEFSSEVTFKVAHLRQAMERARLYPMRLKMEQLNWKLKRRGCFSPRKFSRSWRVLMKKLIQRLFQEKI